MSHRHSGTSQADPQPRSGPSRANLTDEELRYLGKRKGNSRASGACKLPKHILSCHQSNQCDHEEELAPYKFEEHQPIMLVNQTPTVSVIACHGQPALDVSITQAPIIVTSTSAPMTPLSVAQQREMSPMIETHE